MQDNRNSSSLSYDCKGAVCIDTKRVLDSCRDRDCFEDARVYLTEQGEEALASATGVRTKSARILCAKVAVEEVPFNCGFFQVEVRYYIEVEVEICLGLGRSQTYVGIATLEKDVVLYGGDGTITSFSSSPASGFCSECDPNTASTNAPTAIVDTVEPVVLGTRIQECTCPCNPCEYCCDLPDAVTNCVGTNLVTNGNGPKLLVSFGIFSVIRIVRPALLLVQATDYSVPDKECTAATNNENPCDLFRTIAFPVSRFQAQCPHDNAPVQKERGCGCGNNK